VAEHGSEETEEERRRREKEKEKRKNRGTEKKRERVATAFTAATTGSVEHARRSGGTPRDTRNEEKKEMGRRLNSDVGTAKIAGTDFLGDWELGRGSIFERIELNDEKDFEMEFLASDLFWMNFMGVTPSQDYSV